MRKATDEEIQDMHSDQGSATTIVVVIEWNGKKPSSTFYNRLHSYGLYSRSPKQADQEFSLLEWRASQRGSKKHESSRGVILQEGLIVVNSLTLAEDIARWAKHENKAALVQIGHMTVSDFTMSGCPPMVSRELPVQIVCPNCLGGKIYDGYGVEKPCDTCHKFGT